MAHFFDQSHAVIRELFRMKTCSVSGKSPFFAKSNISASRTSGRLFTKRKT